MRRVIWLATLLGVACGDDDGGAPSNAKLGELDQQELDALCDDVDARYLRFEKAFVSVNCTSNARKQASTCEAMRSQCISSTNPDGALIGQIEFSCQGSSTSITTACPQITVSELKACMDGIIGGVEALANQYTCSADQAAFKPPARPQACTDLGDRCPMFAEFSLGG